MNAYAVTNKSNEVLKKSSSGGVFYLLAKYTIEKCGGVVYGVGIENGNVFHKRVDNINGIWSITKSKYVQSDMGNSLMECMNDLQQGRYVLFSGTPCQIGALDTYLDARHVDKNRLITVDCICHGAPQRKYWNLYKKEIFGDDRILNVDFRNKKEGWENYYFSITSSRKTICEPFSKNKYMIAFLSNYTLMESCFKCPFKGENRKSDITLGDFWGIKRFYPDLFDKNGVSLVIVRNKEDFFKSAIASYSSFKIVDPFISLLQNSSYFFSSTKPEDFIEVRTKIESEGFDRTFNTNQINALAKLKRGVKSFLRLLLRKPLRNPDLQKFSVGIITDHGFNNFGNRLQNYALRTVLHEMGFESFNLYLCYPKYHLVGMLNNHSHNARLALRRSKAIKKASIKSGDVSYGYDYSKKCKNDISTIPNILIGSDQIWNYTYHKSRMPLNLGALCDYSNHNYVSYAASIGTNEITNEYAGLFKSQLGKFSAISVREARAQELLSELGFESKVLLDPTLLLLKKDWIKAIDTYASHKIKFNDYTLKYCLSNVIYDTTGNTVDLLDPNSDYYCSNQFDFINLIRNSSLVVTDSFHAFVFSIIFGKDIILLPRDNMKSRFLSLCSILGIEYQTNKKITLSNLDLRNLNRLRCDSIEFLKNCMSISISYK